MRAAAADVRLRPVRNRARYPCPPPGLTGWTTSGLNGTNSTYTDAEGRAWMQRALNSSAVGAFAVNAGTDDARRGVVRENALHTFSIELHHTAGVVLSAGCRTTFYAGGSQVGSVLIGDAAPVPSDVETRLYWSRVPPVGANRVKVDAYVFAPGAPYAVGTLFRASKVMVTEGSERLAYRDGADLGWRWLGTPLQSESVGYPALVA